MTVAVWLREVADTEPRYLQLLRKILCHSLKEAESATLGIVVLQTFLPASLQQIFLMSGLSRIVVLLAPHLHLSVQEKWTLMSAGAVEVLDWPGSDELVSTILVRILRLNEIEGLIDGSNAHGMVIGHSAAWRHVLREAAEVAVFSDSALLVTGETGTG